MLRFSGISEDDVKGNHTSLREVQEKLLSFINDDTILIGHSLETNLCALKVNLKLFSGMVLSFKANFGSKFSAEIFFLSCIK